MRGTQGAHLHWGTEFTCAVVLGKPAQRGAGLQRVWEATHGF